MPMIVAPAIVSTNGNVVLNDPGTTAVGRWIVDIAVTVGTFTIKPQKRL